METKKSILTGTLIASALVGTASINVNASNLFDFTSLGSGAQVRTNLLNTPSVLKAFELACGEKKEDAKAKDAKCGDKKTAETKTTEAKCADGKCGGDAKTKDATCGDKKTVDAKCGDKKAADATCGDKKAKATKANKPK